VSTVTPAQKCESGKSKLAGQYDYRRQKAEAKSATTGDGAARTAGEASRAAHDDYAPCAGIR
jgi:hypothetical protein